MVTVAVEPVLIIRKCTTLLPKLDITPSQGLGGGRSVTSEQDNITRAQSKAEWHAVYYVRAVVLNLVGGTEPHHFHIRIHRTLLNWKHRTQVKNH